MLRYRAFLLACALVAGASVSASAAPTSASVVTARKHVTLTLALLRNPYPIFNRAAPTIASTSTLTEAGRKVLEAAATSPQFTIAQKAEIQSALRVLRTEAPARPALVGFLSSSTSVLFPAGTANRPLSSRINLLASSFDVLGKHSATNPAYASEAFGAASEIVQAGARSLYSMSDPFAARFYSTVAKGGKLGGGIKVGGGIGIGAALAKLLLFLAKADGSGGLLGAANVVPIQQQYVPPEKCTSLTRECAKKLQAHVGAHALASSWGALFDAACNSGHTTKDQRQCPKATEKTP